LTFFTIALADNYGDIFAEPGIESLGRQGNDIMPINEEFMIPLPEGSSIMLLPDRTAIGRIKKKKGTKQIEISNIQSEQVHPVSCVIPPGYTRTLLPAYKKNKNARTLPFFAYTAIAWKDEQLYCAAIETHHDLRWDPSMYNSLELPTKIKLKKKKHPGNRLLDHLERCALEYRCFTAQNIFYERWEGGIPVSSSCNARCCSCISEERVPGTDSPQERIKFTPTVDEIVELAVDHLNNPEGIISFGQGCEGEPLTKGDLLIEAVTKIREKTDKGTININTNGSLPDVIQKLLDAGLDSIRVSLNSAIESRYSAYFRPKGYKFEDIIKSIDITKNKGKFVSLNYQYLPGVNDKEEEVEAFFKFLQNHPANMIQFRNLNTDPDYYFDIMSAPKGKTLGTITFIEKIRKEFPEVIIGNFSIPLR
jgi:wyosine [tRNA(Phe)-imidazoG37] synthetase (radical SAM superfamily)